MKDVDDCHIEKTLRDLLGALILSNNKRIMSNFSSEINGFYHNSIYYGDTDSMYIEKKYWDVLDEANLVGKNYARVKMITKQLVSFMLYF